MQNIEGQFEGLQHAGGTNSRRLFVYNGGFLRQKRLREILASAGYRVCFGMPREGDLVGVWGQSPYAHRGAAVALKRDVPLVRIEDAFLRSLHPGRKGEPPLGLLVDHRGVHFDGRAPSDLEVLLKTHPLDDHALLTRARGAMARMREHHLSKYSATDADASGPAPGYVLVIDQTRGDASVTASVPVPEAARARFQEMLFIAREENPGARIVIRTHPETAQGLRAGHFETGDGSGSVEFHDAPISPWTLLEGATQVYTLSSQMGFEAILAGHRPRVFGKPFYAGWGLTEEEEPIARRQRKLTRTQLFAGAMILYPKWFDPYRGRACDLETVIGCLEAKARAWREDRFGWVSSRARLWKRGPLQKFYGSEKRLRFEENVEKAAAFAAATGRRHMVWASAGEKTGVQLEDGFLRSRGLGAELVPPLSLVTDTGGIHFDPNSQSDVEKFIHRRAIGMRPDQIERTHRLMEALIHQNLSKYNISGQPPVLPEGYRVLVPGQVEDDASIQRGTSDVRTNAAMLARVRAARPDAVILWKPHPDVGKGLRKGAVAHPEQWANMTLPDCDITQVLDQVDEVWTMTSGTGFEALLRRVKVTTLGTPFYAGWGLTDDLAPVPERRLHGPRPTLEALVHAALIDYPRYYDPVTGQACPVEVTIDRLVKGPIPTPGPVNRLLSKGQGFLATHTRFWLR